MPRRRLQQQDDPGGGIVALYLTNLRDRLLDLGADDQKGDEPGNGEKLERNEAKQDAVNGSQKCVFREYAGAFFAGAVLEGEDGDQQQVEQ